MPALMALALILACDGCKERAPASPPDARVNRSDKEDGGEWKLETQGVWRDLALESRLFRLAGSVDVTNRYASAVLVFSKPEGKEDVCSGVLISRHLVLTAGHCVCAMRQLPSESGSLQRSVDGSTCAKTVAVETTLYLPVEDAEDEAPARMRRYRGVVQPHPDLRVVLDEQGQVVSSRSDLALILLDEAMEQEVQPVALANGDVQVDESIIIVGSGYDEVTHLYDGKRRASRNRVTERLPTGGDRMRIAQPGEHHYKGDSGGPCFRDEPEGLVLVGISSRNLGEGGTIISTYGYRDWLRSEIQRVEVMKHPIHPK